MNLQRRKEIRKRWGTWPNPADDPPANEVQDYADICDLFAHIDTLEQSAAERVIADGSRGPTPDYTGEGSAWVPPVEATAVVVPDDTFTLDLDEFGEKLACITINSKNRGIGYELCGTMGDGHFSRRTFDITPYLGHCLRTIGIRAIPAGRVLGEGERRICSEELMYLQSLERYARKHGPESIQDVIGCLDHLRANQGGANE